MSCPSSSFSFFFFAALIRIVFGDTTTKVLNWVLPVIGEKCSVRLPKSLLYCHHVTDTCSVEIISGCDHVNCTNMFCHCHNRKPA